MLLHRLQELNDDLRARTDHHLTLASLLGIVDRCERIVEYGSADHNGGIWRFSGRDCGVRYLKVESLAFKSHSSWKSALRQKS